MPSARTLPRGASTKSIRGCALPANRAPSPPRPAAFRRYHEQDAWTWEHMALTRARPVAGERELCATVMEGIRAVLCAPRDADALLADVASMREAGRQGAQDREQVAAQARAGRGSRSRIHRPVPPAAARRTAPVNSRSIDPFGIPAVGERPAFSIPTTRQSLPTALPFSSASRACFASPSAITGTWSDSRRACAETLARAMGEENFSDLEARVHAVQDRVRAAYRRLIAAPAEAIKQE